MIGFWDVLPVYILMAIAIGMMIYEAFSIKNNFSVQVSNSKNNHLPFLLLFIQPIFMASNLIVARGGVEYVPPISLSFLEVAVVFLLLLPFTFNSLKKNLEFVKQEYKKLFFIGSMGCGVCGAFPF